MWLLTIRWRPVVRWGCFENNNGLNFGDWTEDMVVIESDPIKYLINERRRLFDIKEPAHNGSAKEVILLNSLEFDGGIHDEEDLKLFWN